MKRHQRETHQHQSVFSCPKCTTTFNRKHDQERHSQLCTALKRALEKTGKHSPPEKKQKLADEEVIEYEVSLLYCTHTVF